MVFIIIRAFSYSKESKIVTLRNKNIIIENYIPILTDEEVIEQRQTIEEGLFNIFEKYENNHENGVAN